VKVNRMSTISKLIRSKSGRWVCSLVNFIIKILLFGASSANPHYSEEDA
jgi:hypothetical protein